MVSFLKIFSSLFGSGTNSAKNEPQPQGEGHEHKGFTIRAAPFKENGQYQTCGTIEKDIGGTLKTHRFIRADRFASHGDAAEFSLAKGRQLVDEQGERLFD